MEKITRRALIKGLAGAGLGVVLAGCGAEATPAPAPTPQRDKTTSAPPPTQTLEPTVTPTATLEPIPELNAIPLKGFTNTWDRKKERLEYIDSDGQATAYWNEETKKVELVEGIESLDFEKHKGLFVVWDAGEVEKEFEATGRIALGADFVGNSGQVREIVGVCSQLGIFGVPPGTVFRAPFNARVTGVAETTSGSQYIFIVNDKEGYSWSVFAVFDKQPPGRVAAGGEVFPIGTRTLEKWGLGSYPTAQAIVGEAKEDLSSAKGMTFEDLMRDEYGRIVCVGGVPSK